MRMAGCNEREAKGRDGTVAKGKERFAKGNERFTITKIDRMNPDDVYRYAFAECRFSPREQLRDVFGAGPLPEAMANYFPSQTAEAALDGCRAGLAAREEAHED
jgi:hypothetical protein